MQIQIMGSAIEQQHEQKTMRNTSCRKRLSVTIVKEKMWFFIVIKEEEAMPLG